MSRSSCYISSVVWRMERGGWNPPDWGRGSQAEYSHSEGSCPGVEEVKSDPKVESHTVSLLHRCCSLSVEWGTTQNRAAGAPDREEQAEVTRTHRRDCLFTPKSCWMSSWWWDDGLSGTLMNTKSIRRSQAVHTFTWLWKNNQKKLSFSNHNWTAVVCVNTLVRWILESVLSS